jgi:hypothetical protein
VGVGIQLAAPDSKIFHTAQSMGSLGAIRAARSMLPFPACNPIAKETESINSGD